MGVKSLGRGKPGSTLANGQHGTVDVLVVKDVAHESTLAFGTLRAGSGSQVAEFYSSFDFLEPFEPAAIAQLGTGEQSIPLGLGPVDFELGVIAGGVRQRTLLPGFPDGPSDGTVSLAEAVVPGMLDFLQLPVTHTFMIWNPKVMHQAAYFLEHGAFERNQ